VFSYCNVVDFQYRVYDLAIVAILETILLLTTAVVPVEVSDYNHLFIKPMTKLPCPMKDQEETCRVYWATMLLHGSLNVMAQHIINKSFWKNENRPHLENFHSHSSSNHVTMVFFRSYQWT
jgi:hypothetical protein